MCVCEREGKRAELNRRGHFKTLRNNCFSSFLCFFTGLFARRISVIRYLFKEERRALYEVFFILNILYLDEVHNELCSLTSISSLIQMNREPNQFGWRSCSSADECCCYKYICCTQGCCSTNTCSSNQPCSEILSALQK